jgi:hypothetical protein
VADAQAVEREAEEHVRAARRAGHVVVLGGRCDDRAERRLVRAGGRAHDRRRPSDGLDRVVVEVLVRDEQEVGGHLRDGRVAEDEPPCRERLLGHREGVDHDRLLAGEQERRLAEPADAHRAGSLRRNAAAAFLTEAST